MPRQIISGLVCLALLLGGVGACAQQPLNGSGTQSSAAPQAPAPAKPPTAQDQQTPERSDQTIIRNINLVDVLFTVLNRRNKLVPDLEKENFKVLDNNVQQSIRFFSRQTDLPLRIGMLLDTSNSIRDRIKFEQDAATNFLYSVLRRNKDAAFVMTFDDEPQIIQAFTGEADKLRDQIVSTRAGGGTAIYDAIYEACEKQLSHPPRPPGDQPDVVRRVMILISDGEDNLSNHTRAEAIEMAQRFSVVIYAISTSTQWVSLSQTDPSKIGDRKTLKNEGDQILKTLQRKPAAALFSRITWTISTSPFRTSGTSFATSIPSRTARSTTWLTANTTRFASRRPIIRATRCAPAVAITHGRIVT